MFARDQKPGTLLFTHKYDINQQGLCIYIQYTYDLCIFLYYNYK